MISEETTLLKAAEAEEAKSRPLVLTELLYIYIHILWKAIRLSVFFCWIHVVTCNDLTHIGSVFAVLALQLNRSVFTT